MKKDISLNTVSTAPNSATATSDLTKDYKCNICIEFPKTEDEKKLILAKIESAVKRVTGSVFDLDFLRAKVLDEYDDEVLFMNFDQLSAEDLLLLPWSRVKFEAINLTRGSTILDFRLTFEEPPKNYEGVNVYRLMELFILSAIENIQCITSVEVKWKSEIKFSIEKKILKKLTSIKILDFKNIDIHI